MILFVWKLICLALKAAWGITKGILFVVVIPLLLIALFGLTRELPHRWLFQLAGMAAIIYFLIPSWFRIGQVRFSMEMFGLIALIPIALYCGRKTTSSKAVQWGFYLFYPVHLTALCLILRFCG